MFEIDFFRNTVFWNPNDTGQDPGGLVQFAYGNLEAFETTMVRQGVRATVPRTTGKWYIEFDIINLTNGGADMYLGLCTIAASLNHNASDSLVNATYWRGAGTIKEITNGSNTAYVAGDTVQMAYDLDNAKAWFARQTNTWIGGGSPAAGTTETVNYTNSVGATLYPNYQSDNITTTEQRVRILGHADVQHNAAPSGFIAWGDS